MGSQFFSHSPVKMIKQCAVVIALFAVLAEGQRRGGRRQAPRRGRQDAAGGYEAPGDVAEYAASDAVATYDAAGADDPESGFVCDGQVDGGYYADPEAECQAFHICT